MAVADAGAGGMGRAGTGYVSYALMLEEVARVFTAMSTAISVTNSAVQAPLMLFGTDAQKKKYLRRMATGETLGAFCLTEPAAVRTQRDTSTSNMRRNVYKFKRNKDLGDKRERCGRAAGVCENRSWLSVAKGSRRFLVEPEFSGFRVGRHEEQDGQRSSPSVEILLNDCAVPVENRLGEEGQGLKIALSALDGGRIGIGAQAVGWRKGRWKRPVKYAKQRAAFGKKNAEFQAIQWMIARHADGDRSSRGAGALRGLVERCASYEGVQVLPRASLRERDGNRRGV